MQAFENHGGLLYVPLTVKTFSTPKFLTIGQRQRHNLKMSERELLYLAVFQACLVKLSHKLNIANHNKKELGVGIRPNPFLLSLKTQEERDLNKL